MAEYAVQITLATPGGDSSSGEGMLASIPLGGGIGLRDPREPIPVRCGDCRRDLVLTMTSGS